MITKEAALEIVRLYDQIIDIETTFTELEAHPETSEVDYEIDGEYMGSVGVGVLKKAIRTLCLSLEAEVEALSRVPISDVPAPKAIRVERRQRKPKPLQPPLPGTDTDVAQAPLPEPDSAHSAN